MPDPKGTERLLSEELRSYPDLGSRPRTGSNDPGLQLPFEDLDLTEENFQAGQGGFRDVYFGNVKKYNETTAECRAFPGSDDWPTQQEWNRLSDFLEGSLLKPQPAASVCYKDHANYDEAKCRDIRNNAGSNRFFISDPLTVLTSWPQGRLPEYVLNVTEVWQIQTVVNFARNKNIRLVIKNTGHDFLGRSTGAGAISVWTHFIKDFEFLPTYTQGQYTGPAARVGAGLESWEMYNFMEEHNVTFVTPGRYTVGVYGGWFQGGGHNALASWYGMGADQILSLQVVTAEGKFVTASPEENPDLFYALRGGGPGTYGIVTSAVVKAHPRVTVRNAALAFQTGKNVSVGGTSYNYVSYTGPDSFSFTADNEFPDLSDEEISYFLQPLWDAIRGYGIDLKDISPRQLALRQQALPRKIWNDETLFNATMGARPEPAFRDTYMHADIFYAGDISKTEPFNKVMNKLREVTADGGGAYINESDVEEPNWQTSYFGNKYAELLKVKKSRDPWNVFWAPSTVGSEGWEVRKVEGDKFPSQNGRLCKVAQAAAEA
ncbi:unnamed protein product [Parascedosporium putredinis]|uniref:FAD-binding PCMH-type domain-containing protein n=1 Tax=Parascedosporium putredinis TaxID=1442378 RepID=A0A9P1H430_9PEZI|nr:unnamed protein product [Parascedosporium putredinis]CAI7996205.1 unnamed protein product [Parascedosporium putredinis]